MPEVSRILESALYVEDVARSRDFYTALFGFEVLGFDPRFCGLSVAGEQVLLLFRKRGTLEPIPTDGGAIPPHDGDGKLHFAFGIEATALPAWEARLAEQNIPIESRVHWQFGGQSLFFRDPDGHLVELATRGTWKIY